jgi:hypothetical protein
MEGYTRCKQQLTENWSWWLDKGERWGGEGTLESYFGMMNIKEESSRNFTIIF